MKKMRIFKDYTKIERPQLSWILIFLIIKSYIMLVVTCLFIIAKEKLNKELIPTFVYITQIELIYVIGCFFLPLLYNFITWIIRKVKGL